MCRHSKGSIKLFSKVSSLQNRPNCAQSTTTQQSCEKFSPRLAARDGRVALHHHIHDTNTPIYTRSVSTFIFFLSPSPTVYLCLAARNGRVTLNHTLMTHTHTHAHTHTHTHTRSLLTSLFLSLSPPPPLYLCLAARDGRVPLNHHTHNFALRLNAERERRHVHQHQRLSRATLGCSRQNRTLHSSANGNSLVGVDGFAQFLPAKMLRQHGLHLWDARRAPCRGRDNHMCCSVLQCVPVSCSELQCVAV